MASPRSYRVATSGSASQAPAGAVPIALYGAGGGSGGGAVDSVNGKTGEVVIGIADINGLQGQLDGKATSTSVAVAQSRADSAYTLAEGRATTTSVSAAQSRADAAYTLAEGRATVEQVEERILGYNGAAGLWIGTSAQLPAEADRLPGVLYAVVDPANG